MNPHRTGPADPEAVLRTLDVAPPSLTDAERARSLASLERIVAAPPADSPALTLVGRSPAGRATVATAPPTRRRSRQRIRRLALVPAAALALAAAIVALPGLGNDDQAYASWTPEPRAVTGAELEAVAEKCTAQLDGFRGRGSIDLDAARLALAERRGDVVALLYRTEDPDMSATCLARNVPGTTRVTDVSSGTTGSSGPALLAPAGGFVEGGISQDRAISITDGAVGPDVAAVTIHAGDVTVEATVENGRYVAWWPGLAFETGPLPPSGEGGPEPILTYDLTLTDGTVVRDAQSTRPS